MSALSLAAKSAARSARNYATHMAAVALNAFVYYLFVAVKHDPVVRAEVFPRLHIATAFRAASVVVALFAGIFLWFASSYFMRRRKREAGLYALFGARRLSIALGLFAENVAMGVVAVAAGTGAGIVFARLFLMAVFRLVGAAAAPGAFVNLAAVAETGVVFAVLLALSSLGAFSIIYRYRLSELFGASREAERMPRGSPVLAVASVVLLLAGYALALTSKMSTVTMRFLIVSSMTTVATYGMVRFFVPAAVRALRSNRAAFMRSWRPIAIGNLAFRIGNNVRVFFAIAMVGTVSMVAIGTGLNVKYDTLRRADSEYPFSYSFSLLDGGELQKVYDLAAADGTHRVVATARARYATAKATLGPDGKGRPMTVCAVPASDYRAARAAAGDTEDGARPKAGEALVVLTRSDWLSEAIGSEVSLEGGPGVVVTGTVRGSPVGGWANRTILVLSDDDFGALAAARPDAVVTRVGVEVSDDDDAAAFTEALYAALPDAEPSSFEMDVKPMLRSDDLFLFIGVFIGIVFLASTGSVIHFKLVMEVSDDRRRYDFLSSLGADRSVLEKAVRAQALAVYLVPLALGVVHSVVALSTMGLVFQSDFSRPILLTIVLYSVAYLALYVLSSRACVRAALGEPASVAG